MRLARGGFCTMGGRSHCSQPAFLIRNFNKCVLFSLWDCKTLIWQWVECEGYGEVSLRRWSPVCARARESSLYGLCCCRSRKLRGLLSLVLFHGKGTMTTYYDHEQPHLAWLTILRVVFSFLTSFFIIESFRPRFWQFFFEESTIWHYYTRWPTVIIITSISFMFKT